MSLKQKMLPKDFRAPTEYNTNDGVLEDIEKILLRLYGKGIEPTLGKNAAGRHHWKFGNHRAFRSCERFAT